MTSKMQYRTLPLATHVMAALCVSLFLLSAPQSFADRDNSTIPVVTDLSQDASLARSQELVILIEFSDDYCEYCLLLENEFLIPMSKNREYGEKVIIRSLPLNRDHQFKGFQGELVSASQFASKYQVKVTPTMVFLDANGNELSEKLVGIWSIDFFGSYLDERIDTARQKVL